MEFLTSKELSLNPAGYLINTKTNKPVTHTAFVEQQRKAEYTVRLADAIKDKTFTAPKLDNLDAIRAEVTAAINAKSIKEYVAAPTKPVSKVNEELVDYALKFVAFEEDSKNAEKINKIMAEFDAMDAIESVGDYFSEGLVKLTKIYTTAEVLAAVQAMEAKFKK